jgi:hypothetical protein
MGQEVTLSSCTPHASKVFTTPTMTFEDTFDRQKIATSTSLQILNQMELMEATNFELIKEIIIQLVIEG